MFRAEYEFFKARQEAERLCELKGWEKNDSKLDFRACKEILKRRKSEER